MPCVILSHNAHYYALFMRNILDILHHFVNDLLYTNNPNHWACGGALVAMYNKFIPGCWLLQVNTTGGIDLAPKWANAALNIAVSGISFLLLKILADAYTSIFKPYLFKRLNIPASGATSADELLPPSSTNK